MSAADLVIEAHLHRDCTPEWAEWEAYAVPTDGHGDHGPAVWIGRGTSLSLGAALDKAHVCLGEYLAGSRGEQNT